jgi:hypothetical protein
VLDLQLDQWLAKVDGYHTWLNKWRMQRISPRARWVVFIQGGESCNVPAQDSLNAWTLGGIAIDQVST